jgi:hypothetical protein
MSYISEIQGGRAPLLFKGRVGEGLRKRKSISQLVIQKKVVYKGKLRTREADDRQEIGFRQF